MDNKSIYYDRFSGAIKGSILGDCYGYPLNSLDYEKICDRFEPLGALEMAVSKKSGNALFTDATQLSMFTAEGLLMAMDASAHAEPEMCTTYVFYAYQLWLYTQTKGVAGKEYAWLFDKRTNHFHSKLLKAKGIFKKRAVRPTNLEALARAKNNKFGTIAAPVNENIDCDGVKRCACVGAFFAYNIELAFRMGCEIAAITHSHPDGYLPAGFYSAVIAGVIGNLEVYQAIEKAKTILQDYYGFENTLIAVNNAIALVADESFEPLAAVRRLGLGKTACEALSIAVFCSLLHAGNFKNAIQLAANQDGESSVCASITGGILGAYYGEKNLPNGWLKKMQYKNLFAVIIEDLYNVSVLETDMTDYSEEFAEKDEENNEKKTSEKDKISSDENNEFDENDEDFEEDSEPAKKSLFSGFGKKKRKDESDDESDDEGDDDDRFSRIDLFPDDSDD